MTFIAKFKSHFPPQLLPVFVFGVMLTASWRRWTSLIVDIGRETDLPLRLLNGEMLYRDIHYTYTPFSPYFNAFLFRVFGVHLDTLAISGIVFSALLLFLCYRILRKLMPPLETAIAVSFIAILCVFKPSGNLILPYSFGALHAAVFSLTSVLFVTRFAESKLKSNLIIAGFFTGLAALAKQEFGFAVALTITIYLNYLHRTNLSKLVSDLALAALAALVVTVPVFAVLFANIEWRILVDDCHIFATNIPESLVLYNRFRSGLDRPFSSLIQMIGAAALGVAFASLIVLFSDFTRIMRSRLLIILAISSGIILVVLAFFIDQWDGSPLRAIPFLLISFIFIDWRRKSVNKLNNAGKSSRAEGNAILLIIAVYSLAILFRVILRVPSGGFSGSFYLPTALGLIFYALMIKLPAGVKDWTGDERSFQRSRNITRIVGIVAIVVVGTSSIVRYQTKFVIAIETQHGSVKVEKHSGPALKGALNFIETNTKDREVIAVFPEGNDLAFLTGRRINSRHQVLIPGFLNETDERAAIEALERDRARYIFITNRPMREFGAVAFGTDFYRTLGNWIEVNYRVVRVFGESESQDVEIGKSPFFIKFYERKADHTRID